MFIPDPIDTDTNMSIPAQVDCSTYPIYTTYNPMINQAPAFGTWKYLYFLSNSSTQSTSFYNLPYTTIYVCAAAPGGLGSTSAGGGGGNIIGYTVDNSGSSDLNFNFTFSPIGDNNCKFVSTAEFVPTGYLDNRLGSSFIAFNLNTGGNATSTTGGNGASNPTIYMHPHNTPNNYTLYTSGLGGVGNPSGTPSPTEINNNGGIVNIQFADQTQSYPVVSSGQPGYSGNACSIMVYWQT